MIWQDLPPKKPAAQVKTARTREVIWSALDKDVRVAFDAWAEKGLLPSQAFRARALLSAFGSDVHVALRSANGREKAFSTCFLLNRRDH